MHRSELGTSRRAKSASRSPHSPSCQRVLTPTHLLLITHSRSPGEGLECVSHHAVSVYLVGPVRPFINVVVVVDSLPHLYTKDAEAAPPHCGNRDAAYSAHFLTPREDLPVSAFVNPGHNIVQLISMPVWKNGESCVTGCWKNGGHCGRQLVKL
jgi:hypothetical protein